MGVQLKKKLLQIDQLFIAIFVKNSEIKLLTIHHTTAISPHKMANTKSAIKTIRKNTRETLINKSRKSRFRTAIKKMNTLIEKKNKKDALSYLPKLNSELMKIAKTGIIKKGNATRNLSRLTKKINSL